MRASALALALVIGCAPARAPARPRGGDAGVGGQGQPAVAAPPAATTQPAPLPPLGGAPLVALAVAGFEPAVVSVPLGSTGPRPVLVATHGNFDRPEWQCETWREIVGAAGFVLCPRGVLRDDTLGLEHPRFRYRSHRALEQEIATGLAALGARFGAYVSPGPVVYAGFSQGAIMGVPIVTRAPARFPRLVLLEGGVGALTAATAGAYAAGGGRRVLIGCGQPGCATAGRAAVRRLEAAGLGARVLYGGNVGHGYAEVVTRQVREHFAWLVAGDARWEVARPRAKPD
jgi:predicted esterase